jgi:hypothetical protein
MEAAASAYIEEGSVLLDKGADVNAVPVPFSPDTGTAFIIAAEKGHYRYSSRNTSTVVFMEKS